MIVFGIYLHSIGLCCCR